MYRTRDKRNANMLFTGPMRDEGKRRVLAKLKDGTFCMFRHPSISSDNSFRQSTATLPPRTCHELRGERRKSARCKQGARCKDGSARLRTGAPLTAPHAREVLELLWYSISNMLETCNLWRSAEVVATSCHGQHQSLLGGPFGHVRGAWE